MKIFKMAAFKASIVQITLLFCCHLIGGFFFDLQAQKANFRISELSQDEGLILSFPRGIVQDSFGNIWFGGHPQNGLYRYNGLSFQFFDQYQLENNVHPIPSKINLTRNKEELIFLSDYNIALFNILTQQQKGLSLPDLGDQNLAFITSGTDQQGNFWCLARLLPPDSTHSKKQQEFYSGPYLILKSTDYQQLEIVHTMKSDLPRFPQLSVGLNGIYVNLNHSILHLDSAGQVVQEYVANDLTISGHDIDDQGNLWIITDCKTATNQSACGIYFWDSATASFTSFTVMDSAVVNKARGLVVEKQHILIWGSAFAFIDRKNGNVLDFTTELMQKRKKFKIGQRAFFYPPIRDQSGVYWLTNTTSLFKIERPFSSRQYMGNHPLCGEQYCSVRGITEDETGKIYFAVDRSGLFQLDPDTDSITFLPPHLQSGKKSHQGLTYHQGHLYADNVQIDLRNQSKQLLLGKTHRISNHNLLVDGKIEIHSPSLNKGIIYDPETNSQTPGIEKSGYHVLIPGITEASYYLFSRENMAITLAILTQDLKPIKQYSADELRAKGGPSGRLFCGIGDEDGNIWLGTDHGLSKYNTKTEIFTHYTAEDGLPSRQVFSALLETDQGIWLGTGNGLSWFDFETETFFNFTQEHGIHNLEFNRFACLRSSTGKIYLGGLDGIDAFHPDDLLKPQFKNALPFTLISYAYFDKKREETIVSQKGVESLSTIRLGPGDKYFNLEFRLTDNRSEANTRYSYKLEGYDKEWSKPSVKNSLQYENTPPGKYTLRIRASLSPIVWNENEIVIQVIKRQFWHKTSWAYFGYFILLVALLYGLRKYEVTRLRIKNEKERLEELDQLKTKLYTNITHEFRTPLTVIQGMAEQMDGDSEAKRLIRRNSKNLLQLVNQMLEMSRLESGKMTIQLTHRNIISYLEYLFASFQTLADTKNITLQFSAEVSEVMMSFDANKLQHVIANLLSNAIKFTQKEGQVTLHVAQSPVLMVEKSTPLLKIQVRDNGIGIQEQDLPHIFNRFYRIDETHTAPGTGIGLSLVKEFVELMGGTVTAQSEFTVGTEFTILLPIYTDLFAVSEDKDTLQPLISLSKLPLEEHLAPQVTALPVEADVESAELPLLLLIEDNPDIVTYIQTFLQGKYALQAADNGQAGIEKALEIIPDIIISDVMMPEKDGFEVTAFLKNDERTSHIPIILLTAKADAASKLRGLRRGADVYLPKPFDREELLIRLEKLIELRQRLQLRYSSIAALPPSSDIGIQLEDAFLQKVKDAVHANLDDALFGVSELCKTLNTSQSQLYRKIKALTNKSIAAYIRSIRLARGRELLQTTDLNVSEVAYDVGFTDPNYFSKSFIKEFGFPPSKL